MRSRRHAIVPSSALMAPIVVSLLVSMVVSVSGERDAWAEPPPVTPAPAPAPAAEDTADDALDGPDQVATTRQAAARNAGAEASCCAQLKGELRANLTGEDVERAIRDRSCCELVAQAYERINAEPGPKRPKGQVTDTLHETSLAGAVLQMILVLGAVCLLAYLILGKLLPRLLRIEPPAGQRKLLQVIDRLSVDQRRSIVVIKVGADYFLVGIADGGISLLSRLDPDDVAGALATSELSRPKLGLLAKAFLGRSQKES